MIEGKSKIKSVGLALGSGGSRGLAHIGAIKALVENGIPIDYIAGSSAGALIGGIFAKYENIDQIITLASSLNYKDFVSMFFVPRFSSGILRTDKATQYLENILQGVDIEKLSIPFAAVATDIYSGETITINKGNLASAIIASSSVPLLFEPALHNLKYLVDGAVSMPVPSSVVRDMGANIVIAVNLEQSKPIINNPSTKTKPSAAFVTYTTIEILKGKLAEYNIKDADFVINPKFDYSPLDMRKFIHGEDTINAGEKEMLVLIPKIKECINSSL